MAWLRSEPAAGGAARGNVLFNAAIAGVLTLFDLTSLVEVEMMLYTVRTQRHASRSTQQNAGGESPPECLAD